MMAISEVEKFFSAFLSGIFLVSLYMSMNMLRKIWKHSLLLINLEDFLYWSTTFVYLFVQIYYTNNGIIRCYYVLGVVLGAVFLWKIRCLISNRWKKIVHSRKKKTVD